MSTHFHHAHWPGLEAGLVVLAFAAVYGDTSISNILTRFARAAGT